MLPAFEPVLDCAETELNRVEQAYKAVPWRLLGFTLMRDLCRPCVRKKALALKLAGAASNFPAWLLASSVSIQHGEVSAAPKQCPASPSPPRYPSSARALSADYLGGDIDAIHVDKCVVGRLVALLVGGKDQSNDYSENQRRAPIARSFDRLALLEIRLPAGLDRRGFGGHAFTGSS